MITEQTLTALTTPIYATLIIAEIAVSFYGKKELYSAKDTIANIYLTTVYMFFDLMTRGFSLMILSYFFRFHIIDFNKNMIYWVLLIVFQDFLYWLMHYMDHHCRLFWAAHVVHHSSEEFNLSVGIRASVLQPLYKFIYFVPLALMGFECADIYLVYAITQGYGILVHTQLINRLPYWDYIFVSPSHHRVHHASNVQYLDKNMGMLFIFWDKIFGTYEQENPNEQIQYGLTNAPNLSFPTNIFLHEMKEIRIDLRKSEQWKHKLMYIFGPPGWSHDGSSQTTRQLRNDNGTNDKFCDK